MEKIVLGKDESDLKKYGDKGTALIGRHIVGTGDDAHLTNYVHVDVTRPHVILVCGKRGTGKSYSAGTFVEEIARLPDDIRKNLAVLMIDTMGIYWSMKTPNERDAELLKTWGLKPEALDAKLFVPQAFKKEYEDSGVDVDSTFSFSPTDLTATDWIITFGFSPIDEHGIAIERIIKKVRKNMGNKYRIDDIIEEINADERTDKKIRDSLANRFSAAEEWGIFSEEGLSVEDLLAPGQISILDISHFTRTSGAWSVRSLVVGLLSSKIFQERLMARKKEEYGLMTGAMKKTIPMVWIMMDEAHQFLPAEGETAASGALLTLVKEGREPGISLLFITQMPNKLHPDALSQSDLIMSHRLTSAKDINALSSIMQTYMLGDIQDYINDLPRMKGAAIMLDDNSERIYPIQARPRLSWHAGGSPCAIKEKGLLGDDDE
ncbi:MAG: ATP-binding protein [Candidatus Aenigmarchaeota archaeon]|nr:ATP-binding protein [Candidatus Aenigmarchaeota archaeon]